MSPRRLFACSLALLFVAIVRAQAPATAPADHLSRRYPTGVVAIVEGRVITVADVRREIAPLLPGLRQTTSPPPRGLSPAQLSAPPRDPPDPILPLLPPRPPSHPPGFQG